jgi:hypothetical protein
MKKLLYVVCLSGLMLSAQVRSGSPAPETKTVNNCVKFNVLGIVQVWSGSIDVYAQNPLTGAFDVLVSTRPCGKEGGSWDWFWE